MDYNQTSTTNATFKMPLAPQSQPQPPQSAETLLFNDIMEEKTLALRNTLNDFLQVHSYRKFDIEFSNFLKRARRLIVDGQCSGANISRMNNLSQISTIYSRPSGFNCRPSTTMSMISSNRNSTYQLPENDYLPNEPLNPFKPPGIALLQPKVVVPRLEHTSYTSNSYRSPSSNATVIQVRQVTNETLRENNLDKNVQRDIHQSESVDVAQSYSEITMTENDNMHITDSQHNEIVNDDNSIESLLENVGFKIVLGLPDNGRNSVNGSQHQNNNQLLLKNNVVKYLSKWSLNMKKSQKSQSSKVVLMLTGTLLAEDQNTMLEKNHDAGILECRKDNRKDLVQTKNGVYRLVGSIVSGSPNELYRACVAIDGIPRTWRNIVKPFSGVEKNTKKLMLDFSLDSPAGPIQPAASNLIKNISPAKKHTINGKRKYSEYETENSRTKHSKVHKQQLAPLLASTPKRPKHQSTMFQTPSQYLKNKIHQNIRNKTSNESHHRTLKNVNNSINITKKRQSFSKELVLQQTNVFAKSKTPVKTSLNSKNSTKRSSQSSNNATKITVNSKESKQGSKNNVNTIDSINCSTRSKMKISENASTIKNSLNSTKQKSHLKSSINSTKNSNSKQISENKVKTVKQLKQKKNMTDSVSSSSEIMANKENKKCAKAVVKRNSKKLKDISVNVVIEEKIKKLKGRTKKEKLEKNQNQVTPMNCSNRLSGERGLFDDVDAADYADISDFNILASPGKFSFVSRRTDESTTSETLPLFDHQWSTTAKSLVHSEPPTPLSKSGEAKALKRVKAPKITLQEEIKNHKAQNKKQLIDYKTASKKIDKMLEFGETYDEDED